MIRFVLVLILIPLVLGAAGLAFKWSDAIGERISAYESLRHDINQIEHFSKLSKLELLKIFNGIVLNFDELSKYEEKTEELISEIRKNNILKKDELLFYAFESFAAARTAENVSVESFKSTSSLFRNSETNFHEQSYEFMDDIAGRQELTDFDANWIRRFVQLSHAVHGADGTAPDDSTGAHGHDGNGTAKADADTGNPLASKALRYGRQAITLNYQLRTIIDEVFSDYYKDDYLSVLSYVDKKLEELRAEAVTRRTYLVALIALLGVSVLLTILFLIRALRQLNEAKSTLEDRVIERTRELTAKSDELETYKNELEGQVDARTKELNKKAQDLVTALIKEQQYSKLQKDFVSMISHEFRTPVAIIDMAAQRMLRKKDKTADGSALEEFASGIRKNTTRLTNLIDRTLTSSKFREGHLEFSASKVDIVKLMTDVCAQQENLETGNLIHLIVEPDLPLIKGDPDMLEQVFTNLVGNAVKYSPEKTPVVVRILQEVDTIRIEVIDQGIGIPESEMSKLFERYFRASNARVIAGTGLGLSITKEMIELHGGKMQVITSENKGSAFFTILPINGPTNVETTETDKIVDDNNIDSDVA